MNPPDPPRLLDPSAGASPSLAEALRAAQSRLPDAGRFDAMSQAVGAKMKGSPGGGNGSGGGGAVTTWVVASAVVGALVLSGWFALRSRGDKDSSSASPSLVVATPADSTDAPNPVVPPTPAPSDSIPTVSVEALPSAVSAPPTTPREPQETELHLLERAQDALRTDPQAALELCDEHARRFPKGAFGQEREVLAIDALLRTNRHDEAKQRADRFLAAHPASADRRRIEQLFGE